MLALLAGATVIAEWGALTIQSYDVGIRGFDSLWYHLPWAASFAQTGNVVSLRFTDVEYLTPFYPATAEMLHGLGIVLLGRDTLSPGLNLVWLALTLLAAYCIGRPRRVGAATTIGAALAMGTTMMDYSQAGAAANDVVAVFFLLAAVALLMTDPDRPAALVLAAVAAGLAVGTKLTVLAPVLALTIGVVAIAPAGRRLKTAALWLGPLVVAGGFWYARNLIAVGNPLPWTSAGGILPTPAPPLQQHTGYSVAHYLTSSHFWSAFAQPALAAGLGRWWWAVLAVAILGPVLCLLPAPGRLGRNSDYFRVSSQAVVRMLGAVALFSLAAYLITPETAAGPTSDPLGFAFNLRYLAPALTLALAVAPLAPALSASAGNPDRRGGRARGRSRGHGGAARAVAELPRRRRGRDRGGGARGSLGHGHRDRQTGPDPRAEVGRDRDRHRCRRARARRRRGRRLRAPGPLPPRPLCLPAGRLVPREGLGAVPDRPRLPRRRRRHVRGLLLVSAVRTGSLQPSDLRRPARAKRVVHADRHLRSMAVTGERRPLEIPNHNTRTRPLAPKRAGALPRDPLDRDRPRRHAGVHRTRAGPADRRVPPQRTPRRCRVPSKAEGKLHIT